jgi:hypothetical protein
MRGRNKNGEEEEEELVISPFDIAPEEPLRFALWEVVRSPRFEFLVLVAIICNCVQLALYDPEVTSTHSLICVSMCVI